MATIINHPTGTYKFFEAAEVLSAREIAEITDGKTCAATRDGQNLGWVTPEGIQTAISKLLATGGEIVVE